MTPKSKRVFITGGSGELGRSIATLLAESGFDITLTYFSNHDGAEKTAESVRATGRKCEIIRTHLGKERSISSLFDNLADAAAFDVFIHNAASGVLKPLRELTMRHWDWTHQINCRSFFEVSQWLLQHEKLNRPGRIIALSSLGALRAIPQYAVVGSSKAALESVIRQLAMELGPDGITANVVSPGIIDTWSLRQFPHGRELLDLAKMRTPTGRLTEVSDVANMVKFLCSPESSMVTGQTMTIDGGYSIQA